MTRPIPMKDVLPTFQKRKVMLVMLSNCRQTLPMRTERLRQP